MDLFPPVPPRCGPQDRRSLLGEAVPALIFCDNNMGHCQQAKYGRSSFNTLEVWIGSSCHRLTILTSNQVACPSLPCIHLVSSSSQATVVFRLVAHMISRGIPPAEIGVICFFK